MQQRRVHHLCLWSLGGITLAAVVLLWIFVGPRIRERQVERAIHRFQAIPSQAGADRLMELLYRGDPTPEQGRYILALLFHPRATTRPTYPAGRRPTVALQLPFKVRPRSESFLFEESLCADGRSTDTGILMGWHYLEGDPRVITADDPLNAGQACEAEIRCHIWFATPGKYNLLIRNPTVRGALRAVVARFDRKRAVRMGTPARGEYECDFVVPVSLIAAQDGAPGKIDLLSNPQLDASIRSAFAARPETWMEGRSHTNGQSRSWRGGVTIAYQSVPLAVAFKAALRLPDGRAIPQSSEPVEPMRARAGTSGRFQISVADFVASETANEGVLRTPGEYTGVIILKSDPNLAYDDPAIDAIWNGTLEFPIHFTVALEPNTAQREQRGGEQ